MDATQLVKTLLGEELGPSSATTIGMDGDTYKVTDFEGRLYVVGHGKRVPVFDKEEGEQLCKQLQANRNTYDKNNKEKADAAAIHKFDKAN